MEHLSTFIRTTRPEMCHKARVLVPLSHALGIDPTNFKNKRLLSDAIMAALTYNETDPVTLENIHDIPPDECIAWWQNQKRYVARKTSIRALMDSGQTINPWVTDSASGIQNAENPDAYDAKYNMIHVKSLMRAMCTITSSEAETETVPDNVKEFFAFENICDDLYTTRLTTLLQSDDKELALRVVTRGVLLTNHQYRAYREYRVCELLETNFLRHVDDIWELWTMDEAPVLTFVLSFFGFVKHVYPARADNIIHTIIVHMLDVLE